MVSLAVVLVLLVVSLVIAVVLAARHDEKVSLSERGRLGTTTKRKREKLTRKRARKALKNAYIINSLCERVHAHARDIVKLHLYIYILREPFTTIASDDLTLWRAAIVPVGIRPFLCDFVDLILRFVVQRRFGHDLGD